MARKPARSPGFPWLATGALALLGWRTLRHMREEDIAGEVALVTGGSRGLGLLLARELAREGCPVAICARDERELEAARRDLEARGAQVLAFRCDVAVREEVEAFVRAATERFGRVDLLVNNASILQAGPLEAMTLGDFERAMAVNFWGTVHAALAVLPQMRARRRGRIVNVTSIGGKVAIPHLLPYDCAKFAAVAFSEGLRAELARDGIRVTTIVPGLMRTGSPMNAEFHGDPAAEFGWFSAADATPLTAMSAERAARRIVEAVRRGEAEVTLTWQAKLLRLTHDLFPGATADLMGVANRLLPDAPDGGGRVAAGREAAGEARSPLAPLVDAQARATHQYAADAGATP
ncbi:MAG TPA: SDR family NAD(P)-dependent oxidoreductase [Longimicrobiaceae bacterium]|nr:SDR family NAD(P)-dependent oxidoreductase [Longimicrobiaceae bacterium]